MRFICEFCQIPIRPGEKVVTDGVSAVAHDHCVKKEATEAPSVHLPSVTVSPPPPAPPSPRKLDDTLYRAMNAGFPILKAHANVEPCLMPSAPKVCVVCQKPAISICACGEIVHQDYGYNGQNCSGRHEAKCERARYSREPISDLEKAAIVTGGSLIFGRNGTHRPEKKTNVNKKKRGRR